MIALRNSLADYIRIRLSTIDDPRDRSRNRHSGELEIALMGIESSLASSPEVNTPLESPAGMRQEAHFVPIRADSHGREHFQPRASSSRPLTRTLQPSDTRSRRHRMVSSSPMLATGGSAGCSGITQAGRGPIRFPVSGRQRSQHLSQAHPTRSGRSSIGELNSQGPAGPRRRRLLEPGSCRTTRLLPRHRSPTAGSADHTRRRLTRTRQPPLISPTGAIAHRPDSENCTLARDAVVGTPPQISRKMWRKVLGFDIAFATQHYAALQQVSASGSVLPLRDLGWLRTSPANERRPWRDNPENVRLPYPLRRQVKSPLRQSRTWIDMGRLSPSIMKISALPRPVVSDSEI